ncbi:30S ribosomal protein S6--L-glutamate ligase [Urechidicola croceus]|uniref:Probable alpha-L-glutamate ligase n=1 Tax=Urechidicola croceus TaxID=1850246 RepID=A0A1D8P949_9FLAO|nr:30S ribosomal protein S6--L-glutamate ligase [Urechidicola croceus]AOW21098.1 alpha-L-glutamate ligase [Urechidicola croceus]
MEKITIGSEEWCALSELKIHAIKVRVDSGAKTSSIHAINISTFKKNGEKWVRYEILPIQNNRRINIHCESKVCDTRTVKSSTGISEKRFVIKTPLTIGENTWEIEVTLANRDSMGYRMLLGREAMIDRMIIDPSQQTLIKSYSPSEINTIYKVNKKQESGLKIGLLASNPELYSNKRLIEAGEERGHQMHFLNVQHSYIKMDADTPEIHYRGGNIINGLDAIIPRIKPSVTFYGCALIRQFDSIGAYVLNNAEAITQSRDKLHSSQIFSKNGIQIPTTGFANSPLDTKEVISMVNGAPLIIKLLESTQGKGVVLAETNKAAESVINAFKSLKTNILVQEFIKEAGGRDLRCFVIDGKVVASIERVATKGEFRANIHQGGTANIVKITSEEKKLAIKAAKVLNLDVAGVDLIRSNKGPLLLEVNSSPGLEGIEQATGKDIASMMIAAIEKKILSKK